MKKYILILLALIISQLILSQNIWKKYHPKDIIKEKKIDTCKIFIINYDSTITLQQEFAYDEAGNLIEINSHYQNFLFKYAYNNKSLQISKNHFACGDFFRVDTIIYDRKGRIRENNIFQIHSNRKSQSETKRIYKYKRQSIKNEKYIEDGKLIILSDYTYDEKQRLSFIKRIVNEEDTSKWIFKYGKNDNIIEFNVVRNNGDTIKTQKLKYNDQNLRTELATFTPRGLYSVHRTEYDKNGLIIFEDKFNSIRNSDLEKSIHKKYIYKYTYGNSDLTKKNTIRLH